MCTAGQIRDGKPRENPAAFDKVKLLSLWPLLGKIHLTV